MGKKRKRKSNSNEKSERKLPPRDFSFGFNNKNYGDKRLRLVKDYARDGDEGVEASSCRRRLVDKILFRV